jgi:pyruvate dehydrogenase (quinone)
MLADAGVKRCYGIVGDALNPVIDALRANGRIEFVHVRHEEYGGFAAVGEALLTGQPVAICGTAGPGVTHLINPLIDALHERAPVIAIAGDVETSLFDHGAQEELNPYQFFQTASLYTGRVVNPEAAATVFATAIDTAVVRRGPAVIALPGDVAQAQAKRSERVPVVAPPAGPPAPEQLNRAVEMINRAESVTIFGGDGCRDAADGIGRLAEALSAPLAFTMRGKQWLQHVTPNAVGMTGLAGWGGAHHALHTAELVLLMGCDFPFPGFLPEGTQAIQVDLVAGHIGRRMPVDLGLVADVGATVQALLPLVAAKDDAHLTRAVRLTQEWRKHMDRYVDHGEGKRVRPEHLTAELSRLAGPDAVFTVDTGTPVLWAAQHLQTGPGRRIVGPFSWGTMAAAAPYSFGAALAYPDRQVIALCGDGGYSMLALGDVTTQVRYGARVVNVVYNNGQLDFVNLEQQEAGFVPFGTDLPNPDFAAAAQALGATGIRVEHPAQLENALRQALAAQGPVVVDVLVDPVAIAVPPYVPAKVAKGFTLSAMRQVFTGQAGHIAAEAAHNAAGVL